MKMDSEAWELSTVYYKNTYHVQLRTITQSCHYVPLFSRKKNPKTRGHWSAGLLIQVLAHEGIMFNNKSILALVA